MEISERKTSVGSSVDGSGVYRSAHVRDINGVRYVFDHRVLSDGRGWIKVFRGDDLSPCKSFAGQVRELPGLMSFSAQLGKLLSF